MAHAMVANESTVDINEFEEFNTQQNDCVATYGVNNSTTPVLSGIYLTPSAPPLTQENVPDEINIHDRMFENQQDFINTLKKQAEDNKNFYEKEINFFKEELRTKNDIIKKLIDSKEQQYEPKIQQHVQ